MMNLAIGTAQFGLKYGIANKSGLISGAEQKKILNFSLKNNIDILDTAVLYGDSEQNLGNIGVRRFKVVTKIPKAPSKERDISNWVRTSVFSSMKKLKVDYLHAVLLHNPSDLLEKNGNQIYESLIELKKSGVIKKIGISSYSCDEINPLIEDFSFDIIQMPLNIIDRSLVTSNLFDELKKRKIEIHVRSIFLQGILLLPKNKIPEKFKNWDHIWNRWHSWLNLNKLDPVHACLSFIKSIDGIDKVIVGVDSYNQIKKIVTYYDKDFLFQFPDISSTDKKLINPSLWNSNSSS